MRQMSFGVLRLPQATVVNILLLHANIDHLEQMSKCACFSSALMGLEAQKLTRNV